MWVSGDEDTPAKGIPLCPHSLFIVSSPSIYWSLETVRPGRMFWTSTHPGTPASLDLVGEELAGQWEHRPKEEWDPGPRRGESKGQHPLLARGGCHNCQRSGVRTRLLRRCKGWCHGGAGGRGLGQLVGSPAWKSLLSASGSEPSGVPPLRRLLTHLLSHRPSCSPSTCSV